MEKFRVAIDASFLLKIFLPEDKSEKADRIWKDWISKSVEVVAPTLVIFEVSSVLRNKVYRNVLEKDDAEEIIEQIRRLDLTLLYTDDLLDIAWEIGSQLKMPVLYDCFYIALARFLDISLWTADKKLYGLAKDRYKFVNLL